MAVATKTPAAETTAGRSGASSPSPAPSSTSSSRPASCPAIYNAVRVERPGRPRHLRGPAAPRQQLGAHRRDDTTDGLARGTEAVDTGAPDHRAGRAGDARPGLQRARRADRRQGPGRRGDALSDPPRRAHVRGAGDRDRGVRDRASRSSTSSRRSPRAARSASSAAPASARPSSSRSSSATSPRSTAATPCSRAWASAPARATTCCTR